MSWPSLSCSRNARAKNPRLHSSHYQNILQLSRQTHGQTSFKLGTEREVSNLVKLVAKTPAVNVLLHGKTPEAAFPRDQGLVRPPRTPSDSMPRQRAESACEEVKYIQVSRKGRRKVTTNCRRYVQEISDIREDVRSHHRLPPCKPGAHEPPRHTHDVRETKNPDHTKAQSLCGPGCPRAQADTTPSKAICCYSVAPTVRMAPDPTAPLVGYVPEEAWRTSLKKGLGKCWLERAPMSSAVSGDPNGGTFAPRNGL